MPASHDSPSPGSSNALRRPLWWTALALLLLNDHLLKGSGLLPGSVTGKLSDFAGLIVAPVLAAAVLRANARPARFAAFALVVLPFAAINLSPAAARGLEHLMAALAIPWTTWTDPTDLLALAVLPIAWRLCEGTQPAASIGRSSLGRAGLVLGGFACMATGTPGPAAPIPWSTTTFAVNRAAAPVALRVRWLDAEIDCDTVASDPSRALSPEAFGAGVTVQLEPDTVMPFGRRAATEAVSGSIPDPETPRTCDAVLLQADGLPPTVAFWDRLRPREVPAQLDASDASGASEASASRSGQIDILADGDVLLRADAPNGDVFLGVAQERLGPSGCGERGADTFEWSFADLPSIGSYRLSSVFESPDGCLLLELEDVLDATVHQGYLCVPADRFPFLSGDLVHVGATDRTDEEGELRISLEEEDGSFGDSLRIVAFRRSLDVGAASAELTALECGGERALCGAYVQPAVLMAEGLDPLYPGDAHDLGPAEGYANVRLLLGRAEQVSVALDGCEGARRAIGARGWALFHYQEITE